MEDDILTKIKCKKNILNDTMIFDIIYTTYVARFETENLSPMNDTSRIFIYNVRARSIKAFFRDHVQSEVNFRRKIRDRKLLVIILYVQIDIRVINV